MTKLHKIPVPGGIVGHGAVYNDVVLREPSFREYFDIGDVIEHISYPNGMRIATVNSVTVDRYLSVCLVEPKDPLLLEQGGIALAKEVREAILGFIHGESPAAGASPKSDPTSSSDAAKDASQPAT